MNHLPFVTRNRLLAALPPEALARLRPLLSPTELTLRQVVYHEGAAMDAVYFPEAGMISMVANLMDGGQAEVGVIGREGMLGSSLLGGSDTTFVEAMVQIPGAAWRMGATAFRAEADGHEADGHEAFRKLLLRYNEALQSQIMRTAACNGRHELEPRLCRWLLMCHDRVEGDHLPLTQEFIAMMLGVHRPTVTVAAGILQRAGLIRYGNGRVTVLDRESLEAASCECYAAVRGRFAELLGAAEAGS